MYSPLNLQELSALLLAVKEGHWAASEWLLQHQAPLEQSDSSGRTALMLAAAEGHVGLIELLLDKGMLLFLFYIAACLFMHSVFTYFICLYFQEPVIHHKTMMA